MLSDDVKKCVESTASSALQLRAILPAGLRQQLNTLVLNSHRSVPRQSSLLFASEAYYYLLRAHQI